jgi:hypothetical protein
MLRLSLCERFIEEEMTPESRAVSYSGASATCAADKCGTGAPALAPTANFATGPAT